MIGKKLTITKLTAITNSSNRFSVTFSRNFSLIAITNTSSKQLCNQRLLAWWHSTPQSLTHRHQVQHSISDNHNDVSKTFIKTKTNILKFFQDQDKDQDQT